MESNIRALVLLNLLNLLRKRDKMLGKPHILSLFPNRLINSIKHEYSCNILYLFSFFFPDLSVGLVTVLSDLIWKITVNFYAGHIMCKVVKFAQVSFIIFIPSCKYNVLLSCQPRVTVT